MKEMSRYEVNQTSKFFIKASNVMRYIESDNEIIKAPRTNDPIIMDEKTYLQGSLEGVLEPIQVFGL